jgi:hypothetical protein
MRFGAFRRAVQQEWIWFCERTLAELGNGAHCRQAGVDAACKRAVVRWICSSLQDWG